MVFRNATIADVAAIAALEKVCFPPNEAAPLESFKKRLAIFSNHFLLLEIDGELVGFINGMVSEHKTIVDSMFAEAEIHDENGAWQSVFGIGVAPAHRKKGYAGKLIQLFIEKAKEENRRGVTLTCKDYLIGYYAQFGFKDLGVSGSVHGGEVWHDMVVEF